MIVIFIAILIFFASYVFASSSSLISEKVGIANISIEGNMIIGAILFICFQNLFTSLSSNESFLMLTPMLSIIFAGLVGSLFSSLYAFVVVNALGDQIIAGTGINLLAPALAVVLGYLTFGQSVNASVIIPEILVNNQMIKFLYPIIFTILAIVLIVILWFVFSKTKIGLRIRSSGENPYALETSGHSVNALRLSVLIVSGMLSSIAGSIWVYNQGFYIFTVFGAGYMAVGIVIFSQWSVLGIAFGSLIIGVLSAITQNILLIPNLNSLPSFLILILQVLPYIIPLIILIIAKSKKSPSSLGKPFKKDQR
ncbi:MAG: ABC transporter permease [Mycoplasmataceae bacterium]|nr:ABC transporter permease [Mycoplasmataceae bacterium]